MARRCTSTFAPMLAAATLCLLAAGCGASSPKASTLASSGSHPSKAQMQQDAVRFSGCMRSHGVSDLPDPTSDPHGLKIVLNAKSPALQSALTACRHLLPEGGPHAESEAQRKAHVVALLAFARCMRSHGFSSFPDPTSAGQITHEMLARTGVDINQPEAVQNADACTSVTHGLLTKADVARFVAGH